MAWVPGYYLTWEWGQPVRCRQGSPCTMAWVPGYLTREWGQSVRCRQGSPCTMAWVPGYLTREWGQPVRCRQSSFMTHIDVVHGHGVPSLKSSCGRLYLGKVARLLPYAAGHEPACTHTPLRISAECRRGPARGAAVKRRYCTVETGTQGRENGHLFYITGSQCGARDVTVM
ncbi:hypothetical protein Bbelb_168110 [Branchiostoma belcheri]|nr:hypothetical protein Bbelb_168110 [Branchiostoma belcheri]